MSPKRVSSCEGVNPFRAPKSSKINIFVFYKKKMPDKYHLRDRGGFDFSSGSTGEHKLNIIPPALFVQEPDRGGHVNPFTTGNPFWGTKLLGFSIGRGSGALKGLRGG